MSFPKVSILVPICNVEKYLRQCLESQVNQTLKEIEIICINDGSTDSSLSIIQEFAAGDPRIIVLDKPNSGYGDSMNQGMDLAAGEYIGIVESDDFADHAMFEKLYALTQNGSIDVVRSNYYMYWDDKGDADSFHADFPHYGQVVDLAQAQELLLITPAIWSSIYRRDFLKKNNIRFLPTPGASYQDTSFFIKTLVMADTVYYTEDKFLHYRQDNASSSVKQCALPKAGFVHTEFEETDRYLHQYPRKWERVKKYYNTKKLKSFIWNLCRVDDPKGYMERMRKDCLAILKSEEYKKQYFTKYEMLLLDNVKSNSVNTVYLLLKARKIKQMLLD